MSASDNLSAQLFHGTTADLNPGDIVEPRNVGKHTSVKAAFASLDPRVARLYGEKVYKVEPLEGDKPRLMSAGRGVVDSGARESYEGFRVVGPHNVGSSHSADELMSRPTLHSFHTTMGAGAWGENYTSCCGARVSKQGKSWEVTFGPGNTKTGTQLQIDKMVQKHHNENQKTAQKQLKQEGSL